jgi:hypothetical protein
VISQLREEIGPNDEVIVIGDGDQPIARGILSIMDTRFHYFEYTDFTGGKGNAQRDFGMAKATKPFLMFIDDDDMYWPGAIKDIIHPALAAVGGVPHMFRVQGGPEPIAIRCGYVMGPMFAAPNDPKKLGRWNQPDKDPGISDFFFIRDTLAFYDNTFIDHPVPVYVVRPSEDWHMNAGLPKSVLARLA